MLAAFAHAMLAEYLSFIVLLFALYTVAGGILVTGDICAARRWNNTAILALGTADGQRRRHHRRRDDPDPAADPRQRGAAHNVHVVIFFIILVANIGGALTPLGDPPLFVGFLHGVDFFWTTRHLLAADRARGRRCCWRCSVRSTSGATAREPVCRPMPAAKPDQSPRPRQFRC